MEMTKQQQRQVLWRLLAYTKQFKGLLALSIVCLLVATGLDVYGPKLVQQFIDDYLRPRYFPRAEVTQLAMLYGGAMVIKVVFVYFQVICFQKLALSIIQSLRMDVFRKVQQLGMSYFDRTPIGSIVSRVTNDTEAIKDMFVEVISAVIQNGAFLIAVFIMLFNLDWRAATFCLFILPVVYFIMSTYRRLSAKYYTAMREQLSNLNAKMNESLQGMAIVQLYRQERRLNEEFNLVNEKHFQAGVKTIKLDSLLLRPAIDLVYVTAIIVVLSYFGLSDVQSVSIGTIVAFIQLLGRFFEPINQMMMRLSIYQQAIVAGNRIFVIIDSDELEPRLTDESAVKIARGDIEFRNVSFSYDGKVQVLKNISFTVKEGETIAFVGQTGSGKSSIINLMMRYYEYEDGDVLIDGCSIRDYAKAELRRNVGLVLQDPFIFADTVRENIAFYNETIDDAAVKQAAEFVQAHTFIEKLPEQYEHVLAERGSTLSAGQRQLLAFARTIAANPKVLILDEATANIDTETEEQIQAALNKMRQGRTTIAIAHRLSTIQDANCIYVLHKGEIVEAGTHQELLAMGGLYYKMYLLQNGLAS